VYKSASETLNSELAIFGSAYGLFSGPGGLPQTKTPVCWSPPSLHYIIIILYSDRHFAISRFVRSWHTDSTIRLAFVLSSSDFRYSISVFTVRAFAVYSLHSQYTRLSSLVTGRTLLHSVASTRF